MKSITLADVETAVKSTPISKEVASYVWKIVEKHGLKWKFEKVRVISINPKEYMRTNAVQDGFYPQVWLELNQNALGGRTVTEIDAAFAASTSTVCNSLEDGIVHEGGHAKMYANYSYAALERICEELKQVHILGISKIAEADGAECVAEVAVLLSRGERDSIPKEAIELYEQHMGGD